MENDEQIISLFKSEKTKNKAFTILLSSYKEKLYWTIRRIVIYHEDADDVLQNTFIKIFKNLENFKGDSKLYSWLYRIATNEALTHLKKKASLKQKSIEELNDEISSNFENDTYYTGNKIQSLLQKAILTLPEKQRIVFNMKYFEEMKYSEISEILETSEGALKASYHLAVKKIESYLTEN